MLNLATSSVRVKAMTLLTAKLRVDMRHAGDALGVPHRDETPVHKAADAHSKPMILAIRAAFNIGRKALGRPPNADRAAKAVHGALSKAIPTVLASCFAAGGNVAADLLPKRLKAASLRVLAPTFDIRFDVNSPEAIAYAKLHAADLVTGVSDTTRQNIQDAIAAALEGDGIDAAYDTILEAVGSDARAELISRTEIMDSANAGVAASWDAAQASGLLPQGTTKIWIATSGCCDACDELDGEEVPIDDEFSDGEDMPPDHPACRCTAGIGSGE